MSAVKHDEKAALHEAQAERRAGVETCPAYAPGECSRFWTSVSAPTSAHLREAYEHRQIASQHRAASAALRNIEASACHELPLADRDMSPFHHVDDIAHVEPMDEIGLTGWKLVGARVIFHALPGLTVEWLQRIVDCHLARVAVLGETAAPRDCPLSVAGIRAQVRTIEGGFAVEIRAVDTPAAALVLSRSRVLASRAETREPGMSKTGQKPMKEE